MFRQRLVPESELISTPTPRYAGQPLDFRPPEHRQSPTWWEGPRCGECGGGGFSGLNVIHQWWRDISEPGDPFVVQLVAEDCISGVKVSRTATRLEAKIKTDNLGSAAARRLAGALTEVADLLDAC